MNITLLCVGKIKEPFLKLAIDKYTKDINSVNNISIIEVSDEKTPDNASSKEELLIKDKEGLALLKHIKDNMYVVALDIKGSMLSSEEFKSFLSKTKGKEINDICFIIGGSLGISQNVLKKSHLKISFSKMTFPHQLMRVILLEQLSRIKF